MVSSLIVKGIYDIKINGNGAFKILEQKMNMREVPFVRYRLSKYGNEEINYIKKMMEKFTYSVHMLEIREMPSAEEIAAIKEIDKDVAIYYYMSVFDEDIEDNARLDARIDKYLELSEEIDVDRIALVDKTTKLNAYTGKKMVEYIAEQSMVETEHIGICSSPLSCIGYACMTAVKARELMAVYSKVEDVPLPTAKHEKSCCGCIQYLEVESDTQMIESGTKKSGSSKSSNSGGTGGAVKKEKKKVMVFGATRF